MKSRSSNRIQRTLTVFDSFEALEESEREEWHRMSPVARLKAVETMRQLNHPDYDPVTARLPRFYTVVESAPG